MQILIEPTPDECRRMRQVVAGNVLPRSRMSVIMVGMYAAVIAAAFVLTPSTVPSTMIIGVAAVLGTVTLMGLDARSRWRRVEAADPHAREPYHVAITCEGVRTWCSHVDIRYPWTDSMRISATPEFYLFLQGAGAGLALPRRVLDAGAETELRQALDEWALPGTVKLETPA